MSSAPRVPETWHAMGDDPKDTLARTGRLHLLASAFVRFRLADGTSHSRSLAFATSLVLVQGLVVLVGFAAAFGQSGITSTIVETIRSAVPGPASDVLADAVRQANRVGHQNRFLPLTIGLIGLLITSTTAMGQIERGLNRLYGIERDRPTVRKYAVAFAMTLTVGVGLGLAFLMLGFGRSIGSSWGHDARVVWDVLRWPVGLLLDRRLPRRLARTLGEPAPARASLARVRRGGRRRALGAFDDRSRPGIPALVHLGANVRARSPASSHSKSGRSSRRSASSTASRWPRSSRQSGRSGENAARPARVARSRVLRTRTNGCERGIRQVTAPGY